MSAGSACRSTWMTRRYRSIRTIPDCRRGDFERQLCGWDWRQIFTRFESKVAQERPDFLFGAAAETATLEGTLKRLPGHNQAGANVTVIDLSGVPFDAPGMTVSLISSVAHFGINFLQLGMHISRYWCYIGIPILHIKHRNCRESRFRHHRAGTE